MFNCLLSSAVFFFFFFKQKTAYEMRISDWSSDVCSSDLPEGRLAVVSFHSLEDRVIKRFLDRRSGKLTGGSRHMPVAETVPRAPSFRPLHKGAEIGRASCRERVCQYV